MATYQFRDLPQIDESRYPAWTVDQSSYEFQYRPPTVSFGTDNNMYFDEHDSGTTGMGPYHRFMSDHGPFTAGMLHTQMPKHYEQPWPSADFFRTVSPDRTSASTNSCNTTQNELHSPHAYHSSVAYGSPIECSQTSLPYLPTEHFQGESYMSEAASPDRNVNLRQIEYEPREPETMIEDTDDVDVKQEAICDHEHNAVKLESAPIYREYVDSRMRQSVRDAQSVEPDDVYEEPASDSDYKPVQKRSSKRKRSSTSDSNATRAPKHRPNSRKDSQDANNSASSSRTAKRPRRASNVSQAATEASTSAEDKRPFPCPLAAYGCGSTFASKNEWKRHVSTQHIKLSYWRCDLCPATVDRKDDRSIYHNDFNRKDLFTQHLRRMHAAPKLNAIRGRTEYPVTEDNLAEHQTRCFLSLRAPPQQSSCLFCTRDFDGPASWEERMEHVGHHLEKDRKCMVDMLDTTQWHEDQRLEKYLLKEGLIKKVGDAWQIGEGIPTRPSDEDSNDESEEE